MVKNNGIKQFTTKFCQTALMSFFLIFAWSSNAWADTTISIQLPNFPIHINNCLIDNTIREYPFIIYKNITYVLMTYYDSHFMGLETSWNETYGLQITKTEEVFPYQPEIRHTFPFSQKAAITNQPIVINGSSTWQTDEYPLLLYQGITYFPLTWHYGVEAFQWTYVFDQKNGLTITTNDKIIEQQPSQALQFNRSDGYDMLGLVGDTAYWRYRNNGEPVSFWIQKLGERPKKINLGKIKNIIGIWKGQIYYVVAEDEEFCGKRSIYRATLSGKNPQKLITLEQIEGLLITANTPSFSEYQGKDYFYILPSVGNAQSSHYTHIYQLDSDCAVLVAYVDGYYTFAGGWLLDAEYSVIQRPFCEFLAYQLSDPKQVIQIPLIDVSLIVYDGQHSAYAFAREDKQAPLGVYKIDVNDLSFTLIADNFADGYSLVGIWQQKLLLGNGQDYYTMDFNGKNLQLVSELAGASYGKIYHDQLYFCDQNKRLCRLSTDGEIILLTEEPIEKYIFQDNEGIFVSPKDCTKELFIKP